MQYSLRVRNARLDVLDKIVGLAPHCFIYAGVKPKDCAATATGTILVGMKLPRNWLAPAKNATKVALGEWKGKAVADGYAAYFRIMRGNSCEMQGTVGGKDNTATDVQLTSKTTHLSKGQEVTIHLTLTSGNG